jgi:adenosine kinase
MDIVITGSIAYDYLMSFPGYFKEHILPDKLDTLSVSFLVDSLERRQGGCAGNIAYNLALLGERPHILATAGNDFGPYRMWLEAHGVDCSAVSEIENVATASFFVNTDRSGNQIASFFTGAMAHAHLLSVRRNLSCLPDMTIISPNDPQAMVQLAAECRELGVKYIYDPSQQIIRLSGEDLLAGVGGCAILVLNEYEFEMLRKKTGLDADGVLRSAEALIVTLGENGSHILTRSAEYRIPAVPGRRLCDPTGVGDAYRSGLMKGLALGAGWELAGQMGSLAATYVIEEPGPQSHRYTPAEFVARFRQHFDDGGRLDALCGTPSA